MTYIIVAYIFSNILVQSYYLMTTFNLSNNLSISIIFIPSIEFLIVIYIGVHWGKGGGAI